MTEQIETTQENPETEIIDVIENSPSQPKVFCYTASLPDGKKLKIAVVSMSATDAREGLMKQLPENSSILKLGEVCDYIVQI